jgi:DNA repair ATPase RecN
MSTSNKMLHDRHSQFRSQTLNPDIHTSIKNIDQAINETQSILNNIHEMRDIYVVDEREMDAIKDRLDYISQLVTQILNGTRN